jgi:hypothetical protein
MHETLLYVLSYTAFAALTKLAGGVGKPLAILPVALAAGTLGWALLLWWMTRTRRWQVAPVDGTVLSAGLASVLILISSTLAYSLPKTSILLPLLLMKGGVLTIAPVIDLARGRQVTMQVAQAWLLAMVGFLVGVGELGSASVGALCCAVTYLIGYALKLWAIDGRKGDQSFLLAEMSVTTITALVVSIVLALATSADTSTAAASPLPYLAGIASQGCGLFGGMLLMRRAPHSVCVALNRSASVLAGTLASYLLGRPPTPRELAGALLLCLSVARSNLHLRSLSNLRSVGERCC